MVPPGYQDKDAYIIDYGVYQLPGVYGFFRGPQITGDEYIACIGSAHTFGRFAPLPFPRLISSALAVETLNLGRGGVGPGFPLSNPMLLKYINRARLVIVQVLSGRSQSNSLFHITRDGMTGTNFADGRELSAQDFYTWLIEQGTNLAKRIVAETRQNYVSAMMRMLDAIMPPKILFWFSVRSPEYQEQWGLPIWRLWGEFPHLVNREMVDHMRTHTDRYVECISRRGLPQALFGRDGKPTSFKPSFPAQGEIPRTENRYYPSPEMHEDAAALLIPVCRELLGKC
jgi:hypothetical protein